MKTTSCQKILVIPESCNYENENRAWQGLRKYCSIEILRFPDTRFLFREPVRHIRFAECINIAMENANKYNAIIGSATTGFIWHSIFRLAGDKTPFAVIPHYNHVLPRDNFIALLSSQYRLPQDILISGSRSAGEAFAKMGFSCVPLYPFGIDLRRFKPLGISKATLKSSCGLPKDSRVLIYTGRVQPDKNIIDLLKIFAIVKQSVNALLVVCYNFYDNDYLRLCLRVAESVGNVRFICRPDTTTLVRLYNAADLFVSAAVSIYETFGRSPIEAMACGTPPVVSCYNGFKESINEDCGALIPLLYNQNGCRCPDLNKFISVILSILNDIDFLGVASKSGPEHARQFDSSHSMMAFFESLEVASKEARLDPYLTSPAERLLLSGYPSQVSSLWLSLEGKSLRSLLTKYVETMEAPLEPNQFDLEDFRRFYYSSF